MKILIDYANPRGTVKQVEIDGELWELLGECSRCGKCCVESNMPVKDFQNEEGKCKHFSYEVENDIKVGKCAIHWGRPAFCMLYPRDPYAELNGGCSFKWKRIK